MKRDKKKTKSNFNVRLSFFMSLFFVVLFLAMTVGYAAFTALISISGNVDLALNGNFIISNVTKVSGNNTNDDNPSWTDEAIDFNLSFIKSNEENPVYNATYDITVENNTFYERLLNDLLINLRVLSIENEELGDLDFDITNFQNGEVMESFTNKTFRVVITFTPKVEQDEYDIEGNLSIDSSEKASGVITVNSFSPTTGNIKEGRLQQVTINLSSTYVSDRVFTINGNSDKIDIVDSNGNQLSNFTIRGNSEGEAFTFYLKAKSDALFPEDTFNLTLSLLSNGLPNVRLGSVVLDVDKHEEYVDTTPPIISNVTASMSNEVGVVNLTWSGTDDFSGVDSYTVLVLNDNNTVVQTINNVTNTEVSINGLSNGANSSRYNFKVYGKDTLGNTASSSDISNATTGSGYCSSSGLASYQWVFDVVRNLDNLSFSGENTVNIGSNYSCTISPSNNLMYSLPDTITINMAGRTLSANTDYTYNVNTGDITINNVNGDIDITATAGRGVICLIEGTKVLMGDNTYKNIEDIGYDDLISAWSYNTGTTVPVYPIWIESVGTAHEYTKTSFSDGTSLSTSGDHAVYNYDLSMFVSTLDKDNYHVGSTVAKIENGKIKKVKIKKIETIEKKVKLYHVISSGYFNIISDNVLTTDRTLMISNQYGFTKNITWPKNTREVVISDKNNLYEYSEFKDMMPYYMFKGLRVGEGKYLVNNNFISLEDFKLYLRSFPANPDYYINVEVNSNNKRLWMVTTSLDKVTNSNKNKYKMVEGSTYKLPYRFGVKCYRNAVDNKCYKAGTSFKVYSGMHFIAE